MTTDRAPREPEPLGDPRRLFSMLALARDMLTLPLAALRKLRGDRADPVLVRAGAIVGFPLLAFSLGPTAPAPVQAAWLAHTAGIALSRWGWRRQQKRGPTHSRYVGQSWPEVVGLPPTPSKVLVEPAGWAVFGLALTELGEVGLGRYYLLAAALLPFEWLLLRRRDETLATDVVDARIEAEVRMADVSRRLGG
jgi:hypothetical protein